MPDLLGYDARTTFSKVATNALAAGLGAGIRGAYHRYMAPIRTSAIHIPKLRLGRRRRRFRRKPKAKGRQFKRRGRRYTNRKAGLYRRLKRSFAGNDYRKFRDVHRSDLEINVAQTGTSGAVTNFTVNLNDFPQFVNFKDSYTEVKLVNLSYALEPRSLITGDQAIRVAKGEIPYLAARTVNPVAAALTAVSVDEVRRTPGYTFIPLNRKGRTIINAQPSIMVSSTIRDSASTITINRHKSMPWMPITTPVGTLDLSRMEVLVPKLDAQNGDELRWDVSFYATVLFRGLKEGAVDPVVPPSV